MASAYLTLQPTLLTQLESLFAGPNAPHQTIHPWIRGDDGVLRLRDRGCTFDRARGLGWTSMRGTVRQVD